MEEKRLTVSEFLKRKIRCVTAIINGLSIEYYKKNTTGLNVIVVSPDSILNENDEFCNWECELYDEIDREFPDQDVLITGEYDTAENCTFVFVNSNMSQELTIPIGGLMRVHDVCTSSILYSANETTHPYTKENIPLIYDTVANQAA